MFNSNKHHRRSIRLQSYNYTSAGAYYVTICVQHRECFFGKAVDGEMLFNDAGRMVEKWLHRTETKYLDVCIDSFCIMPNHLHFTVLTGQSNVGADPCVCPGVVCQSLGAHTGAPLRVQRSDFVCQILGAHTGAPLRDGRTDLPNTSLFSIVQWFKTMTTNAYINGVKHHNWPAFNKRLWQRNYYERVLRNESELNARRRYIENNPINWQDDELYPRF